MTEEEILQILWQCGVCGRKFTGYSIRQHFLEHPNGETIRVPKLEGI